MPNGKAAHHVPPRLFDDDADDFLCGTAISVYQNSGGPPSNWGAFENQKRWFAKRIAVRSRLLTVRPARVVLTGPMRITKTCCVGAHMLPHNAAFLKIRLPSANKQRPWRRAAEATRLLPAGWSRAKVHAQDFRALRSVQNGDKCGISNDFWNLYDADFERAVALNCKVLTAAVGRKNMLRESLKKK